MSVNPCRTCPKESVDLWTLRVGDPLALAEAGVGIKIVETERAKKEIVEIN